MKKRMVRSCIICFTIIMLMLPAFHTGLSANFSVGDIVNKKSKMVANGVTFSDHEINSLSGKQRMYSLDVDPSMKNIGFEVGSSKERAFGFEKVSGMASRNDFKEGVILAGVNGDYFDKNGAPNSLVIHNGEVITTNSDAPSYRVIFGVTKEGKALIGKPDLYVGMTVNGENPYMIDAINRVRKQDQLVLFTPYFGSNTMTDSSGTEIILKDIKGVLNGNGKVKATVKEVRPGMGNTKINKNEYVLSGHGFASEYLNQLKPGDLVEWTLQFDQNDWAGVEEAVGGRYHLVKDGTAMSFNIKGAHPRTAIGIKRDGSVFLVVVDGRNKAHSVGVTLTEMAKIMKDFGAVQAMTFDGGGSSTMLVKNPEDMRFGIVNKPSDGKERNVSNALFVVNKAPKGPLSRLIPSERELTLFSGVTYPNLGLTVTGYDESGYKANLSTPVKWSSNIGVFNKDGSFTVKGTGKGKITAIAGAIKTDINVVINNKIDRIALQDSVIALPAKKSAPIQVKGFYKGKKVVEDPKIFTYQVTPAALGSVKNGVFIAGNQAGTGTLTVSYGNVKATTKLIVGNSHSVVIEGFEGNLSSWKASGVQHNSVSISPETKILKYGKQSLKISYDFTGKTGTSGAYAYAPQPIPLQGAPKKIGMWVYGDGKGHWLRAQLKDSNQKEVNIDFARNVSWTGWKFIKAQIPAGLKSPYTLTVPVRYMSVESKKGNGAIYVDQITVLY
ncbi:phosphodiester glycosidase family protein [Peribacillus tepidiphilus]|uniref:phosphodiester glycosidase family protein n=1 Tax=Peribacillus tepidiphilus TaxID=2652445 RepID=UPI001291C765|nr:phosphodiester glycosidase family protein [Peribacillus tepidiphilus]